MNKNTLFGVGAVVLIVGALGAFFVFGNRLNTSSEPSKNTTSSSTNSSDQTSQPSNTTTTENTSSSTETSSITLAQVEANNGKDGKLCWVAVNGTVYQISGFAQWVDGLHTPSGGRARCGKDLSNTIGQSPHGTRVLSLLKEVGKLK